MLHMGAEATRNGRSIHQTEAAELSRSPINLALAETFYFRPLITKSGRPGCDYFEHFVKRPRLTVDRFHSDGPRCFPAPEARNTAFSIAQASSLA